MGRNVKTQLTMREKAELDTLIKRANQRLRELEKQGFTKESAYTRAQLWSSKQAPFMTVTKRGKVKFRTDVQRLYKSNKEAFYDLRSKVKDFLNYKTSTVKGTKAKYSKMIASIEKKYPSLEGTITPQRMSDIFGSEVYKQFVSSGYGSEVVMEILENDPNIEAENLLKMIEAIADEELMIGELEEQFNEKGRKKKKWT